MPDIMAYTTPLSGSAQNNQTFQWTLLLDKCFQSIKAIAMRDEIGLNICIVNAVVDIDDDGGKNERWSAGENFGESSGNSV